MTQLFRIVNVEGLTRATVDPAVVNAHQEDTVVLRSPPRRAWTVASSDLALAFSEDYDTARDRFVAAAQAAGAVLSARQCPAAGPDGRPLYMDAAWLGDPDAASVMVTTSGVHGIEGFAGSALQIDNLRRASLPAGVAVLHIHAVNPFGMAWTCLENEAGVDLNRNFVDYGAPLPQNALYDELDDVFMCPDLLGPTRVAAEAHREAYIAQHGLERYLRAAADGQRHRPGRFNFAGVEPAWSNLAVRDIVDSLLRSARRISWVDVHTGLGDRGAGVMLVIDADLRVAGAARQLWGDIIRVPSDDFPFAPRGALVAAASGMAPWADVVAGALEFGTEPVARVAQAMIERFRLTAFSSVDAFEAPQAMAEIEDCLAPGDTAWRRDVLGRGREIIDATLAGLAAPFDRT